MSNKRIKYLALVVLFWSLLVPVGSLNAGDVQQKPSEAGKSYSGLYMDYDELLHYRAEQGLRNMEPHSIILSNRGLEAYEEGREDEAIEFFKRALVLSPDLPYPYLSLAKSNFSFSRRGVYSASGYLLKAWQAFRGNFWFSFQTYGLIVIGFFFAVFISFIVMSACLICSKLRLYLHDLIEEKKRILLLLPSVVLLFFGPIFGIIGLVLPFWIYLKNREKNIFYMYLIVMVLVLFMIPVFTSFIGAPQDRVMRAIVRINKGIYSGEHLKVINSDNSFESFFSYALDLKRKGHYHESIRTYKELLEQRSDAMVFNNLANSYIGLGKYEIAFGYYKKALELTKMASTYYNLSQLYREVMNFDEGEKNYNYAVGIDPVMVEFYNSVKGTSVNRLVMDETLSDETLWKLAIKRHQYYTSSAIFGKLLSFVNRSVAIILLLFLIAAFVIYNKKASEGAYRCRRCGKIYCSECEKRISQEDVCITCFKTLIKVSELGSKERIERILEIQNYRESRNRHLKFLTILFPGSGHIFHGWTVFGVLTLLFFGFFLSSFILWSYFPAPISMKETSSLFRWISAAGLFLTYSLAVENVFRRIPRRWL
jgi:tetratricopeptide (TPR) repeat protein